MPDIYDVSAEFRRELLAGDRERARQLMQAYGVAYQRIRDRANRMLIERQDLLARGESAGTSWLYRYGRLRTLQLEAEREIAEYARYAGQLIAGGQSAALDMADDHSERLIRAGLGRLPPGVTASFVRLPRESVSDLVAFLADGSPLSYLLGTLGLEAGAAVRDAMLAGVAMGQNPRVIAGMIRASLGGNLYRSLLIARSEVMRSYREATHRSYQANSDVVRGWVWLSARGPRSCMSCIALHGSVHGLDKRLDDHPGGRCTQAPVLRSGDRIQVQTGEEWFRKQDEATQIRMMGRAKHAAWKGGAISLSDLVKRTRSERWGTMRREASLLEALGKGHGEAEAAKLLRKYEHPVRSAGSKQAAATRKAKAAADSGGGGKGGRPTGSGGGDDGERRRQLRIAQLAKMSDREFAAELHEHQTARWGERGLAGHYERHAADLANWIGRTLSASEYAELAADVMAMPERVFTGLTARGEVEYGFTRSREGRRAILLTVSRRGLIRTMFPAPIERWLRGHPEQVEVTDRVHSLR